MKVGIYARVSDERDQSVPVQLADCRDRAERDGLEVVAEYVEDPTSAFDRRKRRPAYERMVANLEAGAIDAPLARDSERLLRQDREGARWLRLYEEGKARRLLFADEADVDLGRAQDRRAWKERVAAAVYYSERLSEKIAATKRRRAAEGRWNGGGRRPFGFQVEEDPDAAPRRDGTRPKRLVHDEREAEAIRRAARDVLSGEASLHAVARRWNGDAGSEPMPKDSGSRWTTKDVWRVLTSPQVAGLRGNGRRLDEGDRVELVEAAWEPILSRDEHELLRARRGTWAPGGPGSRTRSWALASVVRCGECGRPLYGSARTLKDGRVRRSYHCSAAVGGCSRVGVTAPGLERHVLRLALDRPEDESGPPARGRPEDEAAALAELRKLEDAKARAREEYERGDADGPAYRGRREYLDVQIAEVQARLRALEPPRPTRRALRTLGEFWDFMDGRRDELPPAEVEDVNAFLRSAVAEVRVSRAPRPGVRFRSERVEVVWREEAAA